MRFNKTDMGPLQRAKMKYRQLLTTIPRRLSVQEYPPENCHAYRPPLDSLDTWTWWVFWAAVRHWPRQHFMRELL